MKTLLITGASSGIGRAVALEAAAMGYGVTACGRNEARLASLAEANPNIKTLAFDVTDRAACEKALQGKSFDVTILNAGTCEYVDMRAFDPDMFHRVFDCNFFGVVNCISAVLPNLQRGNQLVFIDSLARLLPFTRTEAYGASKAALFYMAKSLDVDLRHRGITVQTVSPGFVRTPLTDKNDFPMPMSVSAEEAGVSIMKLVEKGKQTGYFPTFFAFMIRVLGLLPMSWKVAMCGKMRNASARPARGTS